MLNITEECCCSVLLLYNKVQSEDAISSSLDEPEVEVAREGRELDEANTRIKLLEAKLSELEARLPRANSFPETKVKGFLGHINICHLIISSSGHIAIGSGSW